MYTVQSLLVGGPHPDYGPAQQLTKEVSKFCMYPVLRGGQSYLEIDHNPVVSFALHFDI